MATNFHSTIYSRLLVIYTRRLKIEKDEMRETEKAMMRETADDWMRETETDGIKEREKNEMQEAAVKSRLCRIHL